MPTSGFEIYIQLRLVHSSHIAITFTFKMMLTLLDKPCSVIMDIKRGILLLERQLKSVELVCKYVVGTSAAKIGLILSSHCCTRLESSVCSLYASTPSIMLSYRH